MTCLAELRAILDRHPELWHEIGDVGEQAEMSLLLRIADNNLMLMESMRRRLARLKGELSGPSPSILEKLPVQRSAVSWLHVYQADAAVLAAMKSDTGPHGVYAQRRLDSADRPNIYAIRQLAAVRKLLTPSGRRSRATTPALDLDVEE